MSFRNLRKFRKLQESCTLESSINESSNPEINSNYFSDDINLFPSDNFNRFSIVNDIQTNYDSIFENDDRTIVEYKNQNNMYSEKRRIKKKDRNKTKINNEMNNVLNESFDKYDLKSVTKKTGDNLQQNKIKLLTINQCLLDSDLEMRKLFGKKTIDNNSDSRKKIKNHKIDFRSRFNRSPLMSFKNSWPPMLNNELSMDIIDYVNGIGYFKFSFSETYQDIQQQFLVAVNSLDPNNLMTLLQYNLAYHVSTLLQVSEILKHDGNYQSSIDLVDRALYALGCGFHPMFNISTGCVRLPFKYFENRIMYLTLYKHIHNLEKKGCWRTALEFNKLLLRFSLSPLEDSDNYGALLTIDFFALKAEEYDYIIELKEWYDQEYLKRLPSFAFSYSLALFHKENVNSLHIGSKEKICEAAFTFPWVIKPLFSLLKLSVPREYEELDPPTSLDALYMHIYLSRAKDIWNTPKYKNLLVSVSLPSPSINKSFKEVHQIPSGTLRYVLLSEDTNLVQYLPISVTSQPIMEYDPFPPDDSFECISVSESLENLVQNQTPNSSEISFQQCNFEISLQKSEYNSEAAIEPGDAKNVLERISVYLNSISEKILSFFRISW
ncbi:hypothetical protein PORY_002010 [Pneumocystis oryctolagi]|uniref:Uncharacterized protein n=1 Tax=Pneumocystis oryctolagi TaxID=42067 RepID=A0ACB7CDQ4_9ASCO|nr:hypothetical protein PORY_002010 [Pneumocystis oryctolagi]